MRLPFSLAHHHHPLHDRPPLRQCEALHPILLDVTKPEQVQSAADRVAEENPQGLYCLVNNAGVARSGLIDWFSMQDFRFCMEVRALIRVEPFGQVDQRHHQSQSNTPTTTTTRPIR